MCFCVSVHACLCVCVCVEYGSSIRLWWSALWSQTPIQQAVRSLILPNSTCYMHTQEIMRLGKQGTAVIHHCTLASTGTHWKAHTPTDAARMRNDKLAPLQRRGKTHAPLYGPEKCAGIKRCEPHANLCRLSYSAERRFSAGLAAFAVTTPTVFQYQSRNSSQLYITQKSHPGRVKVCTRD